jgi:hypothetical protein
MSIFDDFSRAIGTDKSSGALAQATGNVLAPGGTFAPGAGGLNPLNPDSIVGRITKDVGSLNPWNPDSTAGKVVNNIGQDMQRDPLKWVAIAAAVATGQTYLIPYINGAAAVTSKNASPEEWLTEGAKAYLISAGGEYVSNNVTGVGPQTDITTGETFAGTGASGAMNSAKAGAVAGNISRNIFATAARKGNTDINSAQIITGAITNEALNEAFKTMPGFDGLSKAEQSATVNAFKVAFNKDSNAAYQLFNQGFDATVKGLDKAAKSLGYKDLNQQNAVNNFVQDQGSTEDIGALRQYEQKIQDAYNAYAPLKEKNDAWFAKNEAYAPLLNKYNAVRLDPSYPYGEKVGMYKALNNQWSWLQDPNNYHTPDVVMTAEEIYNATKADAQPFIDNVISFQDQGWDSLAQQKAATAAGFTTPEAYDTHLTDKKAAEEAETQRKADEESAAQTKAQEEAAAAQAKAQADAQAAIDAETARAAQEAKEAEEQAKRVADFGKDLPGGGVQDLGPVDTKTGFYDKDSSGMGAYKYDPATGNYTFTSDDGSTLTIDKNTNVVGFTEATDTSWAGLTDEKTGNIRLPKLPSGVVPSIKLPAKKPATTTPTTPATSTDPLAAIMGQQQTPVTYQTVTPELANVFYRNKDFSSTPQKINEEGQLVQSNPLLSGPDFLDLTKPQPASALAPQSNPGENDVTSMLAKILSGGGDSASQDELLKILGRG